MAARNNWPDNVDSRSERRGVERTLIDKTALLFLRDKEAVRQCQVCNATNAGVGFLIDKDVRELPVLFALSFDNFRTTRECRLAWQQDDLAGVEFLN